MAAGDVLSERLITRLSGLPPLFDTVVRFGHMIDGGNIPVS